MPISHVANASGGTNPSTSTTVIIPTVSVDDVAILVVSMSATAVDPVVTDDDSGGNAWAKITSVAGASDNVSVWWKRMTSASSAKTVTITDGVGETADSMSACLTVFRGVSTLATPYEAVSGEGNAPGNETHASITTLSAGALVVFCIGESDDNAVSSVAAANTPPGSLTAGASHSSTAGGDTAAGIFYNGMVTPGATGAVTWSMTDAVSASVLFGLIPKDAGGKFLAVL